MTRKNRSISAYIKNGELSNCLRKSQVRRIRKADRQEGRKEIRENI